MSIDQTLTKAGCGTTSAWKTVEGSTARASVGAVDANGAIQGQDDDQYSTPAGANPSMMNHTKEFLEEEHLRHFGLNDDPFAVGLGDHHYIWMPDRLKRVKNLIEINVKNQGILVLTGASGSGKSTILRHVLGEMLQAGKTQVIAPDRLNRSAMTGDMLTVAIIDELGPGMKMPRAAVQRDKLAKKLLAESVSRGHRPLLVIDESHDLRAQMFIAIKRLWDSGLILSNLSVILAGQGGKNQDGRSDGLRWEIEGNPDLKEFAERCRLVDLGSLIRDLPDYLRWRFAAIGGDAGNVFSDRAVEVLVETACTPQLLANIAVKAMREAFFDGDLVVGEVHVSRVS